MSPTILIVEDEVPLLEILVELLEDLGYRIITAQDGRTALHLAIREQPSVVLTDVILPQMSGADLCRAIKDPASPARHVKVALMSASASGTALGTSADAFVAKPFDIDHVERVVRRLAGPPTPNP